MQLVPFLHAYRPYDVPCFMRFVTVGAAWLFGVAVDRDVAFLPASSTPVLVLAVDRSVRVSMAFIALVNVEVGRVCFDL